jgi:hypothetical protein
VVIPGRHTDSVATEPRGVLPSRVRSRRSFHAGSPLTVAKPCRIPEPGRSMYHSQDVASRRLGCTCPSTNREKSMVNDPVGTEPPGSREADR